MDKVDVLVHVRAASHLDVLYKNLHVKISDVIEELRKPKAKPDLLDFEVLKTLINSGGKVDGKRAKRPAISKYLTATTLCADEGVKLGTNTLEVLSDMINFSIEQNTHLLHMVDSINEDR